MDNASKAIIIAGGVLIAIAIISTAIFFYNNARSYASRSNEIFSSTQIQSFNRFYTAYDSPSHVIRVVDAINILNRALEDNIEEDKIVNGVAGMIVRESSKQNGATVYWYKIANSSSDYIKEVHLQLSYNANGMIDGVKIQP